MPTVMYSQVSPERGWEVRAGPHPFPNSNRSTTELSKSNSITVRDKESSNPASKLLSDAFKLITEGISRPCHLKRNFREGILFIFFCYVRDCVDP